MYFYHDYSHSIQYNLKEELAKGDHFFEIPKIFPQNAEFQRLLNYRIPRNTTSLEYFLLFCVGLFSFTSLFFLFSFIRTRNSTSNVNIKLLFFPLGIVMTFYMFSLFNNIMIFYSQAPYKDYIFTIQNIVAYVPFLILLLIIPLCISNWRIFKTSTWSTFSTLLMPEFS